MEIERELLERLDQWHEENHHKEIIREIEGLPEEIKRDYGLRGRLARALNNTQRYREALGVLEEVQEEGREDSVWWSRKGYALYYLDRCAEAADCFRQALRLNPENGDARTFLAWMNIGPGGKANAWNGAKDKKDGPRPAAANNSRPGEAASPRRPKAGSGANDWGSRGWEDEDEPDGE